jgi:hypothetical protein
MNTRYSLLALALCGAPALFGAAPSVRLERDVPVQLRLKQARSSETARVNDRVEFEVVEEVSAAGMVVIPKGSTAWGRVSDAAPVGRLMRSGRLAVDIESVALADGASVRLRASANHPAPGEPSDGTSDSLGALPALPFTMFRYGKAIQIPAGKLVTAYTAAPVNVAVKGQPRQVSAVSAIPLPQAAKSASVLPAAMAASQTVADRPATVTPSAPSAAKLAPAPQSASVLPAMNAAPQGAAAADDGADQPATTSASALTGGNASPQSTAIGTADRTTLASARNPEAASVSRGSSKKLVTILAVGAAAGLAGVLAAKGHGGSPSAAAAGAGAGTGSATGTTATTVGIGSITVGGLH